LTDRYLLELIITFYSNVATYRQQVATYRQAPLMQ